MSPTICHDNDTLEIDEMCENNRNNNINKELNNISNKREKKDLKGKWCEEIEHFCVQNK